MAKSKELFTILIVSISEEKMKDIIDSFFQDPWFIAKLELVTDKGKLDKEMYDNQDKFDSIADAILCYRRVKLYPEDGPAKTLDIKALKKGWTKVEKILSSDKMLYGVHQSYMRNLLSDEFDSYDAATFIQLCIFPEVIYG